MFFVFDFQSIARTKNFIDLIQEYREGISVTSKAGRNDDSAVTRNELDLLEKEGLHEDVRKLEALSAQTVSIRRSIRVEKFVVLLGFVEDLPFAIMNSILLVYHRDHIAFTMIYGSTLLTFLGFGMKCMSVKVIYRLRTEFKYLKSHIQLQRNHSIAKIVPENCEMVPWGSFHESTDKLETEDERTLVFAISQFVTTKQS